MLHITITVKLDILVKLTPHRTNNNRLSPHKKILLKEKKYKKIWDN